MILKRLAFLMIIAVTMIVASHAEERADASLVVDSVTQHIVKPETVPTAAAIAVKPSEPADTAVAIDATPIDSVARLKLDEHSPALLPYEPIHGMDWYFFKNRTNPNTRPYTFLEDQTWSGIPIFFAGMIAKSQKTAFRQNYKNPNTRIRLIKYNFHSEIDNYTQYVPLALSIGLKLGGYEGRSSWPRYWASAAASAAIMAGLVNGIKYTSSEMRPDGSTRNSWPSGHTATAFMAATILHKEYGLTRSKWFSVGAYTLATATGVMRVLNNRHWISDVLSGAGIGIFSVELGYGLMDLLFKERGLLRNDISAYPDLRTNPSFFAISMGIGVGNRNLNFPGFSYDFDFDDEEEPTFSDPVNLKFRSSMVVGGEGAYFFNPYIGIGGRLRVKSTPINGWSDISISEQKDISAMLEDPDYNEAITNFGLTIESDHLTEFAADAGVYFSYPFTDRFAIGSKLLVGRSIMNDLDIRASFDGYRVDYSEADDEIKVDKSQPVHLDWDYLAVSATNSMKFGSGISLTYALKNSFSWRVFCDYDYCRKTFTATYAPFAFFGVLSPESAEIMKTMGLDVNKPYETKTRKSLHQWSFGAAFCVSF